MADDAAIRRENLRRLCAARAWGPRDLEQRTDARYTYWRDLLKNPAKSFGEKAARHIEEQLELPRGWLDQAGAPVMAAAEPPRNYIATRWLFSTALFAALEDASTDTLRRCENVLRAMLDIPPT
jgi:hypothetical protein